MTPINVSILIIVPTLDSYLLVTKLLSSLQSQTFVYWKILFVDGPSRDDHRQWLERCCASDSRCSWIIQDPTMPGIFGAMNQGFSLASPVDWLLFWGSDDWAAAPHVLAKVVCILARAESEGLAPDLLVCRGRYADAGSGALGRPTAFQAPGLLGSAAYRRALLLGSTPPHQATLFGPGARRRLARYAPGFSLSADLDYFLQLSRYPGLRVQCLDLELVHMADGGVSGQQSQRRFQEVRRAYLRTFGSRWWFSFLARYLRRLASLLEQNS